MLQQNDFEAVISGLGTTIALDLETTGLDPHKDQILGIALADDKNAYFLCPTFAKHLKAVSKDRILVLQNFKFDFRFLAVAGCDLFGARVYDTKILHHLMDENMGHTLADIMQDVLSIDGSYKAEFWGKYKNAADAPLEELGKYAMDDVRYTLQCFHKMYPPMSIPKKKLSDHMHRLAMELYATERDGLKVDLDYVMNMGSELQTRIHKDLLDMRASCDTACSTWEMQEWVRQMDKRKTDKGKAGVPKPQFSFSSNKQLGELFYDLLGLPEQLNKENRRTVDDAALERLETYHPAVKIVRDYREAEKLHGTYIKGVLDRMVGERIYPTFNECGTVTGRISHSNPNMGNMPRDGGLRGMFIPDSGNSLISADYSQLEICLAAHFSEDAVLLDTVRTGKSMRDITAAALGCDRQLAKTLNFGILYGASRWKVMELFKCSESQAEQIIDKFFKQFPGLKRIIDQCHAAVENDEYIVNPFGRTRTFRGQWSGKRELERCKRQAFNSLIQGTGGDLASRAFYLVAEELRSSAKGRGLFTVHDELLVEARNESVAWVQELLAETMARVGREINLLVPLTVAVSEPMPRWED